MSSKIKLRSAPSQDALREQQLQAEKLLGLDNLSAWTEEPTQVAKPARKTAAPPPAAPVVLVPPKKPWELSSAEAVHPYHIIMPERLFQKLDWSWKRLGLKSQRAFVLQILEQAAEKSLKDLGE